MGAACVRRGPLGTTSIRLCLWVGGAGRQQGSAEDELEEATATTASATSRRGGYQRGVGGGSTAAGEQEEGGAGELEASAGIVGDTSARVSLPATSPARSMVSSPAEPPAPSALR